MSLKLTKADLLVTPEQFSVLACLDGGAFGVKTHCDACSQQLNGCMRQVLLGGLISNQARAESELGWSLTSRYIQEIVSVDKKRRVQLAYPGVAALNVKPQVSVLQTMSVSPYVHTNLTPVLLNGECVVEVSGVYIDDPDKAVVRLASTGKIISHRKTGQFPVLNAQGNWLIALDIDCSSNPVLNVHHCTYAYASAPAPQTCSGKYKLRTPSGEFVPMAKPHKQVGTSLIFTMYWWSLVKPAFSNSSSIVDLSSSQPEWYKFENQVQLLCESDVVQLPEIISYDQNCFCAPPDPPEVVLVNASRGIVELKDLACRKGCPMRVKLYYRVDPDLVDGGASNWLSSISEAIVYLTAAELPLTVCGCKAESGFIALAQQVYAEQRIGLQGDVVTNIKYGTRHGQLVYAERMSRAYHFRRRVVL